VTSAFAIEVTEDPPDDERERFGRIRLDDFVERFLMDVDFWSPDDYRESWRAACGRLVEAPGDTVSCLVASTCDPTTANYIWTWPLYRVGDTVFVQNHIVFLDELETPLDPTRPWLAIKPRRTHDEEDQRISDWSVPLAAVRRFLET
jgi:hypothetical protein